MSRGPIWEGKLCGTSLKIISEAWQLTMKIEPLVHIHFPLYNVMVCSCYQERQHILAAVYYRMLYLCKQHVTCVVNNMLVSHACSSEYSIGGIVTLNFVYATIMLC